MRISKTTGSTGSRDAAWESGDFLFNGDCNGLKAETTELRVIPLGELLLRLQSFVQPVNLKSGNCPRASIALVPARTAGAAIHPSAGGDHPSTASSALTIPFGVVA